MASGVKLPFKVDETIYDVVECTSCENFISIGSIQLGVRAIESDSSQDEDDTFNWYHFSCFFDKYTPKSVADIDGFEFLSGRDQEEIRTRIDSAEGSSGFSSESRTSTENAGSVEEQGARYKSPAKSADQSLDELLEQKLNFSSDSSVLSVLEYTHRAIESDDTDSEDDGWDYMSGLEANKSGDAINRGRRNIRQIIGVGDLDQKTRKVVVLEEARRKRVAERQKLFPDLFETEYTSGQPIEKLVLDYDPKRGKELVAVNSKLLKKLKLHQVKGVRFMWDACFESLEQVKKGKGGGCILAHCMGLGKTLQVITLVHTLLSHPTTKVSKILILCPLSTVLNWKAEFEKWLGNLDDWHKIGHKIYELSKFKTSTQKVKKLQYWDEHGGVMILGYDSFRSLVTNRKTLQKTLNQIRKALLNPGPQLVICDEGHLLKNEKSALSQATMEIKTLRRIALTGTPLQNNLNEYYCMVQFVKPYLLGNKGEFRNRFVNPIENGQFVDSDQVDVRLMKDRALVLHEMLEGIVQRFDYTNVLKPLLPPKLEFVISVGLSDLQAQLYELYINRNQERSFLEDYNRMRLIWTHPYVMKLSADRRSRIQESEKSANESINSSFVEMSDEWWSEFVSDEALEDYARGPKFVLLFAILKQCEVLGDKILIFSQSIPTLDVIEYFLSKSPSSVGKWRKDLDYFRLDGQTKSDLRSKYCEIFNRSDNTRARLFLISTKAGGLGINLTAANRVIIFDASWNPSFDIQSIFRVCRVGQTKPSYIYRFLSQGTMEEKIYERQVTKLSVSGRVVDNQQINRHFSRKDIEELYLFDRKPPLSECEEVLKKLPKPSDVIMTALLKEHKNVIVNYHEHDSLLENVAEEKLTEAERKVAWMNYETERSGKMDTPIPETPRTRARTRRNITIQSTR